MYSMKKIEKSKYIYSLISLILLIFLVITSFFANEILRIVTSNVCIMFFTLICFFALSSCITKKTLNNVILSKLKQYLIPIIFFLICCVWEYWYSTLLKCCELLFSFDVKSKIIILVFSLIFLTLNIVIIVNVWQNNKKYMLKSIDKKDFNNTFKINEKTTKKLDYYFDTKSIDGAILLNGRWGSGKTYYIEKYVDSFNSNRKERAVYVSLNGLKTIDEVNNALFVALHPVLSATKNSPIIKVLECATKYTSNLLSIDYDSISEINVNIAKFDASLIVFDDLERCQVDVPTLFGYIDLIKKSCNKIILVADEIELINYLFLEESFHNKMVSSNVLIANNCIKKEINSNFDKKDSCLQLNNNSDNKYNDIVKELREIEKIIYPKNYYEIIKEKIVWDTISFIFDINVLFDSLINYPEYCQIKQIIFQNKELIYQIENKSKCSNLRTYKYALDLFRIIHLEVVDDISKCKNKDILLRILIVNTFALVIACKHPLKFEFNSSIRINTIDYRKMNSMLIFYSNISYDKDKLIKELLEIDAELSDNDEPDYIVNLKNCWVYKTDEELTFEINKLFEDYQNNSLKKKYFINCYHYFYSYLIEYGFEDKKIDLKNIENELLKRIDESNEFVEQEDFYFIQKKYSQNEMETIKKLYKAIKEMNERHNSSVIVRDSLNISKIPFNNIRTISEQALGKHAFLSLFSVDDLVNYIKNTDNDGIEDFRVLIHNVYGFGNIKDYFSQDKETIIKFNEELEKYKDTCESKTKKKLIEWFIDNLKSIVERL